MSKSTLPWWRVFRIKKPASGYCRAWLKCKECGNVYFYDYTPYGLGNPVTWLPCGHSTGRRVVDCSVRVTEFQAWKILTKQKKAGRQP
jgi:hypothetical protein